MRNVKSFMAIVVCFVLAGVGTGFGEDLAPGEYTLIEGEVFSGDLNINSGVTVNMLPGCYVDGGVNVNNGGILNIWGGELVVNAMVINNQTGAVINVYGLDYSAGIAGECPDMAFGVLSWVPLCGEGTQEMMFTGVICLGGDEPCPTVEPDPEPEINVDVNGLVYDFGDVAIGDLTTVIVPIYNYGDADLTVSSVLLYGSYDFYVTDSSEIPFTIAAGDPNGVDLEVTFAPSEEGMLFAALSIVNNDSDEGVINVVLTGLGTVDVIPPEQQIQAILDFYDDSVADGTLEGNSPGHGFYSQFRAALRLRALRCMIKSAGDLINAGAYDLAIRQLRSVAKKTDGQMRPMDFVVGDSVETLNAMVDQLIADLTL